MGSKEQNKLETDSYTREQTDDWQKKEVLGGLGEKGDRIKKYKLIITK